MDKLIMQELKATNILSSRNVLDLKKYISLKYVDLTPKEKANILADAIRRTIGERIPKVQKSLKTSLIDNIIKTSVNQGSFDISSEDVFIECLNLKYNLDEDTFLSELCSWLNKLTVKNIEKENMKKFIHSVYSLDVKSYNTESISTVLEDALLEKHSDVTVSVNTDRDTSDIYFESEHLSERAFIDTNYPLSIEKTPKHEVVLALDKVIEKNHSIIQNEWFNKVFFLKNIAILISFLLVFSLKTNNIGNDYIIGSNANNTEYNLQSIVYDIPSQNVSVKQNQVVNVMDILINRRKYGYISDSNISRGFFEKTKVKSANMKKLIMEATAYDLSIESCGKSRNHPMYGITAAGTKATIRRTVAVDSSVIPLGSRLYIKFPKSYSNLDGIYIAEDTGSKVKGSIIDIFLGEDKIGESIVHKKVDNFGRQRVEVSLIK